MTHKIEDLREELFDTLSKVKSGELDLGGASIICEIARVIVDSARAETEFVRSVNALAGSGFITTSRKEIE